MGLLRLLWADFDAAYPDRNYSLPMLIARLAVFTVVIIAATTSAAAIARDERLAWVAGLIILGFSVPPHFYPGHVWQEYPPWYHYAYLSSILPLAFLSGRLARRPASHARSTVAA